MFMLIACAIGLISATSHLLEYLSFAVPILDCLIRHFPPSLASKEGVLVSARNRVVSRPSSD